MKWLLPSTPPRFPHTTVIRSPPPPSQPGLPLTKVSGPTSKPASQVDQEYIVETLCKHLYSLQTDYQGLWQKYPQGYLVSDCIRLKICPVPSTNLATPGSTNPQTQTTTLHELFLRPKFAFSVKIRVQLAARLASSVLPLYSSGWLEEDWSSRDIMFLQDGNGNPQVENPLAHKSMYSTQSPTTIDSPMSNQSVPLPIKTTKILLSLGIVLGELHHKKCWEDFMSTQFPQDIDYSKMVPADRRFHIATKLHASLEDTMSHDAYREVLGWCVWGMPDIANTNFDEEYYKSAVYTRIVQPLQDMASTVSV